MNLPNHLSSKKNWILVGPLGPKLELDQSSSAVMAVDGGLGFVDSADFWVGDGDSNPGLPLPIHHLLLPRSKDHSDLRGALDLLPQTSVVQLWGFLGGRRDHELAVLGECQRFLKNGPGCDRIELFQGGSLSACFYPGGSRQFRHQGLLSLFVLERGEVTLRGALAYPLPAPTILEPLSSHGLSNEASGEVTLETSTPVLVYRGGPE